jgi:hypothetical protein
MPSPYVHFTEAQVEDYIASMLCVTTLPELNQKQDQEEARLIQACHTYHQTWRLAELDQKIMILELEADEAREVGGDVSEIESAIATHVAEQEALKLEVISLEQPDSELLSDYNADLACVRTVFHKLREYTEEPFLKNIYDGAETIVDEMRPQLTQDAVSLVDTLFETKDAMQFVGAIAPGTGARELTDPTVLLLNQIKQAWFENQKTLTDEQCERVWLKHVMEPCQAYFYEASLRLLCDELPDIDREIEYKDALLSMVSYLLLSLEVRKLQKSQTCAWPKAKFTETTEKGAEHILFLTRQMGSLRDDWKDVAAKHAWNKKICLGLAALALVSMFITTALPFALSLSFGLSMALLFVPALSLVGFALAMGKSARFECKIQAAKVKQDEGLNVYGAAVEAVSTGVQDAEALKLRFFPPGDGVVSEAGTQKQVFSV